MLWKIIQLLLICSIYLPHYSAACGVTTHIEISYRALYNYHDIRNGLDYDTVLQQNQDALEAGSGFPDAFYTDECFNGQYHQVSEDTHWIPFINASINYIRRQYPKPWNKNAQKLVSFIMGVLSHQVADVPWHSLGIDQGFLQAMARTNYHGDFPSAHSDGDLGGDVLNLFQLNLSYSEIIGEWYVPVDDLLQIYKEYYRKEVVTENVITDCTKLLYAVKIAERLAVREYFPISAKRSTYLVDELYGYFLGGIDDMAMWTQRIWKHFTFALENGQKQCKMDHNPLFVRCNDTTSLMAKERRPAKLKNGFYINPRFAGSTIDSIKTEKKGKGIIFRPGESLMEKLKAVERTAPSHQWKTTLENETKIKKVMRARIGTLPKIVFTVATDYASCGSAYAVADLNGDGNEDVIIGCPGYYSSSHQKSGMVFIMFGTDEGLNTTVLDLSQAADVRILGPEDPHSAYSKFGSSLAILDFDKDGTLDIAIGAPSYGSVNLTYTGRVFLYSPVDSMQFKLRGSVTCEDVYCNLGTTLKTGDLNSDLYNDLIIGSQFAPGKGEQRGAVSVVHADRGFAGKTDLKLKVSTTDFSMQGSQNYSWLGSSVVVKKYDDRNNTYFAVGEPNFRKCARSNCSFDPDDVEAIGQVQLIHVTGNSFKPGQIYRGEEQFLLLGGQMDIGRPFGPASDILAIAAPGHGVKGHILHIPAHLEQVGTVYLYNLTNPYQYPVSVFSGERRFGRFGAQLQFADLNRDGFDDLIIGAPLWTADFTEALHGAQQGRVYVFYGGSGFPVGDATSNCKPLHVIEPCPGEKASAELQFDEDYARFGSKLAVVRAKNKTNLLVTAEHSSKGGRLAGAIGLFDF